jgi:hypothetical protein
MPRSRGSKLALMARAFPAAVLLVALLFIPAAPQSWVLCHRGGPLEDPFGHQMKTITVFSAGARDTPSVHARVRLRHGPPHGPRLAPPLGRQTPLDQPRSCARRLPRGRVRLPPPGRPRS